MPRLKPLPYAIALGLAATSISMVSHAETSEEQDVERIAVWSTQVNVSSTYLQGEEIANKQADHLSDLLRTIPGVDVGGAHSLNQRISIRSMDDKDLMISIDGASQNTYMYHHMGNLQIHADILQSVDIDIGTNSVINGGLGGAVRFETKQALDLLKPEQTFGARVQYSAGDNAGSNYSLTGYGLLGNDVDVLVYFNDVERDNYEVGGGRILDANGNLIPGTDGEVRGLEGDLQDALFKLGWNITENQRVSIGYETYEDEGNYSYRPDMGLATDLAITQFLQIPLLWPTEFSRDTLTFNYHVDFSDNHRIRFAAYNTDSDLWRDERGWAQNPRFESRAGIITGEAQNEGINAIGEWELDGVFFQQDNHQITYGFDYIEHDTHYRGTFTDRVDESSENAESLAIFVQDRIAFNSEWTVIPGVRFNQYDIESEVVDNDFTDTTFALALEFQPNDGLVFKASITELFKGPEIGEVFVGAGLFDTANPNIEAETGTNAEFSVAYQGKVFGADSFTLGGTLFRTNVDDYIFDYAPIPGGGPRDQWKANVGDMEIDGFESYLGYNLGAFKAHITYSSAESELDAFAAYQDLDGARIDRQQGDTLSASLNYDIESLDLALHWEVLSVEDVEAGLDLDGATLDNAKDSFTVHNISATWQPANIEGLRIIVGVDNLFDEFYASQSSRTGTSFHPLFGELYLLDYEPGRNVKATIAYQF